MKEDLRVYSDEELSLRVFNEEDLYRLIWLREADLYYLLDELFIYSDKQLEILKEDIEDAKNENLEKEV